jgi:hypothetical protein
MFEDRLAYIRKRIPSLGGLGFRPVRMADLGDACREFAEIFGYQFVVRTIRPQENIDPYMARGFSYSTADHKYVVVVNDTESYEKTWYFGAHECAHVLLHSLYLRPWPGNMPFFQEVEEEAHFFAQLCFWPLNRIFFEQECEPPLGNEEKILSVLVNHQKEFFRDSSYHLLDHKAHLFAYLFLRRMERMLPRNYQKLMNLCYPII